MERIDFEVAMEEEFLLVMAEEFLLSERGRIRHLPDRVIRCDALGGNDRFPSEREVSDRSHQDLLMLRQTKSVAAGIREKLVVDAQSAEAAAEKAHLLHKACNKELCSLDIIIKKD